MGSPRGPQPGAIGHPKELSPLDIPCPAGASRKPDPQSGRGDSGARDGAGLGFLISKECPELGDKAGGSGQGVGRAALSSGVLQDHDKGIC